MFDHSLFLGLPLSEAFLRLLAEVPDPIKSTFIHDTPTDYLQKVECNGVFYLGKCLESPFNMAALDALQENLYSLLKKVIPDYPYEQHPLLLFPLEPSGF